MAKINENYLKLRSNYLFADIARRVTEFQNNNPNADIIRLGIGDVTRPLAPAVIGGLHKAVDHMGALETFKGYPPEQGYPFLRQLIAENDYASRGVSIDLDEIFVSDGAKSDTANLQELFGLDNTVAVTDPVYPVYVDSNVMAGRTGDANDKGQYEGIIYLPCSPANGFVPDLPDAKADLIYLCYPNNPTGAVATKEELKKWVDYARRNNSVILYDAAYESYIQEERIPRTIYEVEGAKEVAIEFRSFSKTAGFTGTRCGFAVVPKALKAYDSKGNGIAVNPLWNRWHSTKFNGVAYIIQSGAAAVYTPEGQAQVKQTIGYYMDNAKAIKDGLASLGIEHYGGINAPYIWLKTPGGLSSWEFFDRLLNEANVVGTPGAGFGSQGEGYFRLTAFGSKERTEEAIERLKKLKF